MPKEKSWQTPSVTLVVMITADVTIICSENVLYTAQYFNVYMDL